MGILCEPYSLSQGRKGKWIHAGSGNGAHSFVFCLTKEAWKDFGWQGQDHRASSPTYENWRGLPARWAQLCGGGGGTWCWRQPRSGALSALSHRRKGTWVSGLLCRRSQVLQSAEVWLTLWISGASVFSLQHRRPPSSPSPAWARSLHVLW